jgi:hypothetical protein
VVSLKYVTYHTRAIWISWLGRACIKLRYPKSSKALNIALFILDTMYIVYDTCKKEEIIRTGHKHAPPKVLRECAQHQQEGQSYCSPPDMAHWLGRASRRGRRRVVEADETWEGGSSLDVGAVVKTTVVVALVRLFFPPHSSGQSCPRPLCHPPPLPFDRAQEPKPLFQASRIQTTLFT